MNRINGWKSLFLALIFGAGMVCAPLANAAARNFTLNMTVGDKTIDVLLYTTHYYRTFYVWGFSESSTTPPNVGGVTLNVNTGDAVTLSVYNNTNQVHGFAIKGLTLSNTATIAAFGSQTYTFTAPATGSYIYYDPLTDSITKVPNRAVGMVGAMIVFPEGQTLPAGTAPSGSGTLWTGGPSYTTGYTWVLTDFDKNWNAAAKAGTAANPSVYKPNYAFINGQFGHDSIKNPNTSPYPKVIGDTLAIRVVNTGNIAHPLHFHGYHAEVVRVDNVVQTRVLEKDVVDVQPQQTVDLIIHINQRGVYIMHDHTGMMVTQDGIYAEGMIAEIDACKYTGGTTGDDYCPVVTVGVPGSMGGM